MMTKDQWTTAYEHLKGTYESFRDQHRKFDSLKTSPQRSSARRMMTAKMRQVASYIHEQPELDDFIKKNKSSFHVVNGLWSIEHFQKEFPEVLALIRNEGN